MNQPQNRLDTTQIIQLHTSLNVGYFSCKKYLYGQGLKSTQVLNKKLLWATVASYHRSFLLLIH